MSVSKSVNKDKAKVGDSLVYTVKVTNVDAATVNLRDVVVNDILSEFVTFTHGSVQVDSFSAKYSYDNASRNLSVPLLEIAPGQTKIITFECIVNTTAYGKNFTNTAVSSAKNEDDKSGTDGGVTVDNGTPEGSAGAKTVSASTAKVGDTLTYTLTLRNASTATSDWKNIEIKDVIPENLSFINGSVEEDGRATTNFSYDANTKTLTLFADSVAVGADKKFTFKVTVDDGAQGLYIVNTATVESPDRDDIQLPDTGVQIDSGNTDPTINKYASVKEAHEGDIFSYEIKLKNGANATAVWKNVILTDVIPDGLKLVAGTVTLNSKTVSYGLNGDAIEVTVGDLKANEEAIVKFEVRVLESAVGKTIKNVATAKGDNGETTGTDEGVDVPKAEEPTDPNNPNAKVVTGSKDVDKTLVSVQDKVTFTITAKNTTDEAWKGVQIYDVLDTSMVTLITDTMFIDGIKYSETSGKWSFSDKTLIFTLGDIEPGKEVVCKFSVQIKNDAAGYTYVNNATIKGTDGKPVYVKAPEITIQNGTFPTENHYKLFVGHGDNLGNPLFIWQPDGDIKIDHMFILGYRLMTDDYRKAAGNGTITVPSDVTSREAQYFISHGIISANEYTSGAVATQSQVYRILNATAGANLSSNSTAGVKRIEVANLVCDFTKRDKTPNTNGLPLAFFSDKGAHAALIDEVSNSHDYTIDSAGNETWISILPD